MKRAFLAAILALPLTVQAGAPTLNSVKVLYSTGVPVNGTNEVQTITFGGTPNGGGSFTLRFGSQTTNAINWNATNATLVSNINSALQAMSSIGSGGVAVAVGTMTAGIGTIIVTFQGNNAKMDVVQMTVPSNTLTGTSPTVVVSTTTPGVTADARNQAGQSNLLVDHTNGNLYIDRGTTKNPNWTLVGP